MARIEKTVFISYRRSDVYTALAVYENLKNQGYDVFFDYRSISSGDFEQIITSNIRARAHFVLILTPTALDRLNEPGDWLRREIEIAIDEKRNIIPLFFKGFRFGSQSVSDTLAGKLKTLSRYNGLNVHEDYFDEAMHRLRSEYLNKPLDTVLHPVSTEVQNAVRMEQNAADKALEQIEDVQVLVKQGVEKPEQKKESPKPATKQPVPGKTSKITGPEAIPWRMVGVITGGLVLLALSVWGGTRLFNNPPPTIPETTETPSLQPATTQESSSSFTDTPSSSLTPATPTPTPGIGSRLYFVKDGMIVVYIPAGKFTMGDVAEVGFTECQKYRPGCQLANFTDESPPHAVDLQTYWIDQTEVTNGMYTLCVSAGRCKPPTRSDSNSHPSYYGNRDFDIFPVIYVDWNMAKVYCEWAGRRLPTEAEWEKAARGDDGRMYPWGNNLPGNEYANFNSEIGDATAVMSYEAGKSPYGAYDMAGNVWEWVADWYDPAYYQNSPSIDPLGPGLGQSRVYRGGTWYNTPDVIRSAIRGADPPESSGQGLGFRCAISAAEAIQSTANQPVATPALDIGSTMTGKDDMTLLYIPAGEFTMGSDSGIPNEAPIHTVYLDAFWIDKTEVTNKMYSLCVKTGLCREPTNTSSFTHTSYYGNSDYDNYPVIYVDWSMARTYCEWTGRRLPTEAEWEKAARGTDQRVYPWGNTIDQTYANYNGFVGDATEVGNYEKGKSFYGAFDMAGNVWEWVNDWYSETYYSSFDPGSVTPNPLGPDLGEERVLRGGSWGNVNNSVRSANRTQSEPTHKDGYAGFRCAMGVTP